MLRLLFIEDEPEAIEPVQRSIEQKDKDIQIDVVGFEEANSKIASFLPDIVVLDLLADGASAESEIRGLNIHDFIWDQHFCPIIVYSAEPSIYEDEYDSHPFVKSIQKGRGSPQKVLDAVDELRPHVAALKGAESDIRRSFSCAMRDVAPYAFEAFIDADRRMETIKRSGRRRLAALMDELPLDGTTLASWEQYLCPPVCDSTQLGDILRKVDEAHDDPASFRVVLTPSCDLVSSGKRDPKVSNALVAKCCSMKDGLGRTSWKDMGMRKLEDRLPSILTQGYFESVIPFPGLKNRIPTMAVDLRDLELIPVNDISISDGPFRRIASVDSPFRELVAWAYMQIAGRPGLPDRDSASWTEEIIATLESERSEKKK